MPPFRLGPEHRTGLDQNGVPNRSESAARDVAERIGRRQHAVRIDGRDVAERVRVNCNTAPLRANVPCT